MKTHTRTKLLTEKIRANKSHSSLINLKNKFGFTLAEVLITLGIVGIVAAMTLPQLINKYQERVFISQLKAAYTLLSQSFKQATNDYGDIDSWGANTDERINNAPNILSKYLKVVKTCPKNNYNCSPKDLFHYSGPSANGTKFGLPGQGPTIIIANGMSITFRNAGGSCNQTVQEYSSLIPQRKENVSAMCMSIYVDINGTKKPNYTSKDLFEFYVLKDGIVPAGTAGTDKGVWTNAFTNQCKNIDGKAYSPSSQAICTAWVITNNNMDYLHCPEKISWDGPFSCKDAK